jgi:hypothetical protein
MILKTVNDYIPQIQEQFPMLSEKEIRRILNFGFRIYGYVNKRGADVLIKNDGTFPKVIAFTGYLTWDSLKHYQRGLFKWSMKERILYSFRNTEWDGYYYFGMQDEDHHLLLDQLSNNAIKYIKLKNVFCYKAPKEIYHNHKIDYVYKLKYPDEVGYKIFYRNFREEKCDISYVGINPESTHFRLLKEKEEKENDTRNC